MISACCSAFGQAGGGRIKYPAIPGPELVLCLENKVNKSPCGADVRTDVPAAAGQNPGGKSLLRPLSLGFRKGKRAKGYAFVHIRKADFLAICIVRSPGAQDAPPPILAGPAVWASAPGTRLRFCPLIPGTRRRGVAGQKQEWILRAGNPLNSSVLPPAWREGSRRKNRLTPAAGNCIHNCI